MALVRARGLHERVHIIAGVMPLKSHKVALYMKNKVAGMIVPDAIVERLKNAKDPKEEGVRLCVEQIEHLRTIEGVRGVHIMAMAWEEKVPEIVHRAGLRP
jgi:methylenetetrahydrofolate reductase (NADPH)